MAVASEKYLDTKVTLTEAVPEASRIPTPLYGRASVGRCRKSVRNQPIVHVGLRLRSGAGDEYLSVV